MWIIAGPNGAGKSTFAQQFLLDLGHGGLTKLNADERVSALRETCPDVAADELNLRAAVDVDRGVAAHIDDSTSFLVETVLSSPKYRGDVERAKAGGMRVGLIYVSLHPPELSPLRVSERVAKGGHAVDPAKAVDRYARSHEQLRWFAPRADLLMIFDNSAPDATPILLASRVGRASPTHHVGGINPAVDRVLRDIVRAESSTPPATPSP